MKMKLRLKLKLKTGDEEDEAADADVDNQEDSIGLVVGLYTFQLLNADGVQHARGYYYKQGPSLPGLMIPVRGPCKSQQVASECRALSLFAHQSRPLHCNKLTEGTPLRASIHCRLLHDSIFYASL
jgi:hypothetical protein